MSSVFDPSEVSRLMESFRFPRADDCILKEGSDPNTSGVFTKDQLSRDVFLWQGYMKAGDELVDTVIRKGGHEHDLVYPIIYCYRHALELAMKWIICQYLVPVD